ncbi:hypothetical protein PoB_002663200 [Plakobranchus ocellatus]|uniref:Uncharacterized protein n=1 Tax=Plakobranchus ocellatus TaxID=259542 RepID=A0AAV3ZYI7_9GAST|nr:hypothetical protein PoB_002663200 [Plakobranchus ocellatus]
MTRVSSIVLPQPLCLVKSGDQFRKTNPGLSKTGKRPIDFEEGMRDKYFWQNYESRLLIIFFSFTRETASSTAASRSLSVSMTGRTASKIAMACLLLPTPEVK